MALFEVSSKRSRSDAPPKRSRRRSRSPARDADITLGVLFLAALISIVSLTRCDPGAARAPAPPMVSAEDQRAYEAMKAAGYSEPEARQAAPAVRELCEANRRGGCR